MCYLCILVKWKNNFTFPDDISPEAALNLGKAGYDNGMAGCWKLRPKDKSVEDWIAFEGYVLEMIEITNPGTKLYTRSFEE